MEVETSGIEGLTAATSTRAQPLVLGKWMGAAFLGGAQAVGASTRYKLRARFIRRLPSSRQPARWGGAPNLQVIQADGDGQVCQVRLRGGQRPGQRGNAQANWGMLQRLTWAGHHRQSLSWAAACPGQARAGHPEQYGHHCCCCNTLLSCVLLPDQSD